MSRHLQLPDSWAPRLLAQGETGMGYQTASVTLLDGRVFPEVVIVGGIVSEARGYDEIPFSADQISDITVTHRKWAFRHARGASTPTA